MDDAKNAISSPAKKLPPCEWRLHSHNAEPYLMGRMGTRFFFDGPNLVFAASRACVVKRQEYLYAGANPKHGIRKRLVLSKAKGPGDRNLNARTS